MVVVRVMGEKWLVMAMMRTRTREKRWCWDGSIVVRAVGEGNACYGSVRSYRGEELLRS